MPKQKDLLERARTRPQGMRFSDFEALLRSCAWEFRRQSGSHRLWASPTGFLLPVQVVNGKAKAYQVRQFPKQFEHEIQHGKK